MTPSILRLVNALLSLAEVIEKDAESSVMTPDRRAILDAALNEIILMRFEAANKVWDDLDNLEVEILKESNQNT